MGNPEGFCSISDLKHVTRNLEVMGILTQAMKTRDIQLCSRGEKSQTEKLVNNVVSLKGINLINILQTKAITTSMGQSVDISFKRS